MLAVCWYIWDGSRYRRDDTDRIIDLAKQATLGIFDEAKHATDETEQTRISKHAVASQKRERIQAAIALARPELAVRAEDLDADPWLLNFENGTIDLRTGRLQPHDPGDLITKLAPVAYDSNAKCPLWDTVLDRTFNRDASLIAWLQRFEGMALTGDIREQIFPVFYGSGNNGKNVNLRHRGRLDG